MLSTGISDSSDATFLTADSSENATFAGNLTVSGNLTVTGTTTQVDTVTMNAQNAVLFEGATADAHETTLTTVDPTGDRTISLPNVSGTLPVLAAASVTQISSTPEELNLLDGSSANSVVNSKAVIYGSGGELAGTLSTAAQTNITSVGTLTGFRSTGIDDNADALAITIDSSERVLIGTDSGDSFNADSMLRLQRAGDRVFMQFKTDADQNSGILFGDVDDDVECAIEYEPANKALTFSTGNNAEAIRIDTNGKVGIGTTSPGYEMHIQKAATETSLAIQSNISPTGSSVGGRLRLQLGAQSNSGSGNADTSAGDFVGQVLYEGQGTDYSYQAGSVNCLVTTGDGDDGRVNQGAALTFGTMSVGATSQVEKMRLTAKGDLCVGGTNEEHTSADIGPSIHLMSDTYGTDVSLHLHPDTGEWSLYAYNGFLGIIDHTANVYRMKIASNGEVTFGTTNDYSSKLTALEDRADHTAILGEATSGSFTSNVIDASCTRNTANASYRLYQGQRRGQAVVFSVNDAGNTQNVNNSFSGLSDERLKINIEDASSQWDDIKALRVRNYEWGQGNTGHKQIGLVSQEVEAAGMKHLIEESDADEYQIAYNPQLEGEKVKTMKYSVLYMKAVKALQEAQLRIENLEAENSKLIELENRIETIEQRLI